MKKFIRTFLFLLGCLSVVSPLLNEASAQRRKEKHVMPGEQVMVYRIVQTMVNKDPDTYAGLFPDTDTMSKVVMKVSDSSSKEFRNAMALQNNATAMLRADSAQRAFHKANFDSLIKRGETVYGIHWSAMLIRRYNLTKARLTRDARYEKLAPERFSGIVFITDPYSDANYAFTVTDILLINGAWYGGEISLLLEARDEAQYTLNKKKFFERRRKGLPELRTPTDENVAAQTPAADSSSSGGKTRKMVVERKFYTGMFDNEIPIQLYIRRIRGGCPDTSTSDGCLYDGMYKFGDQDGFIQLEVQKTEDGVWHLTEVPSAGEMELTLKEGTLTGTWLAEDGQSGYDARLGEITPSTKKLERLESVINSGVFEE